MKSNLISAIAGWKSAALLALVAMVAAVAFSGVLSTTQTAEAQFPGAGAAVSGEPGKTVTVSFTEGADARDRFRISSDSEGSATFAHNGGKALRCGDASADGCDVNVADTSVISLQIAIDEDTPIGEIYIQRITRSGVGAVEIVEEVVLTVTRPNPPVAIKALNRPASAISKDASGDGTMIQVQVVNARGAGIAGLPIQVTTTRGGLTRAVAVTYDAGPPVVAARALNATVTGTTCVEAVAGTSGGAACSVVSTTAVAGAEATTTADDIAAGVVSVVLKGNGGTGKAEVVFRHLASGLSHTVNVVLHGDAGAASAAVDQSTIGIGGSTFIVVTVTDSDGNPVVGDTTFGVRSNKPLVPAVTGPEVPAGSSANLLTYAENVNRDLPGVANDLPSCAAVTAVADDPSTTDADETVVGSTGTNLAGKCVIQVTAPDPAGSANDATRGTHSVTIGSSTNPRIPTVTVEIEVGGSPASIETDAPERVDSLSTTKITVTVMDDEGVRVGAVPISVVQVEGDGQLDDVPGSMTSDGRGSFTFLAPLSEGEAVFLIRAGDAAKGQEIRDTITLAIGEEPDMDDMDDMEDATWNKELVSGQNLVVWNGADGADPSDGATDGVQSIWSYNAGAGTWDGYFADAADVPGGNTLTSLTNGDAYWVIVE